MALNDVTDEGRFPTPAQRRQAYTEASTLVQAVIDDMVRLHASVACLQTYADAAQREGIKVPLDSCIDAMLPARLTACRQLAKRLTRLSTVGG